MEHPKQKEFAPRRLLRVNDAVAYTAMSRATLYAEIKAGRLSPTKLGHATRFEVSELDRWINETSAADQGSTRHD